LPAEAATRLGHLKSPRGGATITDGPALSIGSRGTLNVDRLEMPLPFVVRACDEKGWYLV
jgi:hypothetical protein